MEDQLNVAWLDEWQPPPPDQLPELLGLAHVRALKKQQEAEAKAAIDQLAEERSQD